MNGMRLTQQRGARAAAGSSSSSSSSRGQGMIGRLAAALAGLLLAAAVQVGAGVAGTQAPAAYGGVLSTCR
jgi:hypothetical protein